MGDFIPITTQAEFDAAIGERLKRERESFSKKYGDYDELKSKVASYEQQIGQMTEAAVDAYHQALEQHQTRQEEPDACNSTYPAISPPVFHSKDTPSAETEGTA